MKKIISTIIISALLTSTAFASVKKVKPESRVTNNLVQEYLKNYPSKKELAELKKKTLAHSGKAVPALIKVMKSNQFPEKNRWIATFLLGQIMGEKSAPFISKFVKHPNWVMRMASLKTLMALKQRKYTSLYKNALQDQSLIVRTQALEVVKRLKISELAPNVWAMLYDKRNYYQNEKNKSSKRIGIIKNVIKTVGDLKFEKAKAPLFTMVQKKKYEDIFPEMDYALERILNKKSPEGPLHIKKRFWKRLAMSHTTL